MIYWSNAAGGFLDDRLIVGNLPEDAVAITTERHAELLAGQAEGKRIVADGTGTPNLADQPAADRAATCAYLSASVDAAAELERSKYITAGSGQAMAYIEKARQAAAYLAAEAPDEADYPLLVAEVGITGKTVANVATVVDTAYRDWIVIGGAIEAARLAGKKAIAEAEDAEAAQAAYDAIEWPEAE
ncbi:hypothetical protein JET14_13190 [Martelella lutilitoris]|uniref:DUF4376 domain-containing protein n=1 Tax=Martelella lutilitoris TaxID=2583532 RepID=A0A7T7KK36_9HYPH|nr:hypothetical protein [Martelella lutilitoris]QQM29282.1 hypothetical protein JET14_13190 [Martelella lutilitoris]